MSLAIAPPTTVHYLRNHELTTHVMADRAILVLTSQHSLYAQLLREGVERLANSGRLAGLAVGILPLESPAAHAVRRDNPWIDDDQAQPYVVLFRAGRRVEGFPVSSAGELLDRLERRGFIEYPAHSPHALESLSVAA